MTSQGSPCISGLGTMFLRHLSTVVRLALGALGILLLISGRARKLLRFVLETLVPITKKR